MVLVQLSIFRILAVGSLKANFVMGLLAKYRHSCGVHSSSWSGGSSSFEPRQVPIFL